MKFQKSLLTATLFAAASLTAVSANAADNPATSKFDVKLKVNSICTVKTNSINDIDLGSVDAGKATDTVTGSTNIILNCSKGTVAKIALTPKSTNSVDGTGKMSGGLSNAEEVKYKLTSVSKTGTAWGNGATNSVSTAAATKYATDITTTVYATVIDTADVTPGNYSDTVNVSVTY